MSQLTLVILAAGAATRYGGGKQTDTFGPSGESIMEYSIYDAINAGFTKVVFVIKEESYNQFKEVFAPKLHGKIEVDFAFQTPRFPEVLLSITTSRTKPWGTGHAIYSAVSKVSSPFAVINADDFYGREAFENMAKFLLQTKGANFSMVGYRLKNTLSDFGSVSRARCKVDAHNKLIDIKEFTKISKQADGALTANEPDPVALTMEDLVSMNLWGFTTDVFELFNEKFNAFLEDKSNFETKEFYIAEPVQKLISEKKITVEVIPTSTQWFGVTYKEEKPFVVESIRKLVDQKVYPENLWK